MIITVASGKGGTGKTTVAVNMALSVGEVNLLDCDVEEPNVHTLIHPEHVKTRLIKRPIPLIDQTKCTLCGRCEDFCEFNALFVGKRKVLVYPEMCHSCGGCSIVCPEKSIIEMNQRIGKLHTAQIGKMRLVSGELDIGQAITTTVIKAVKSEIEPRGINILDAPPGTACSVIETIRESDYLLLVTEPTPFGLHDLNMIVQVIEGFGIPQGVIVNRVGIGDDRVDKYCIKKGIPILLKIPYDRTIAELYSCGVPFIQKMPDWQIKFKELFEDIKGSLENAN